MKLEVTCTSNPNGYLITVGKKYTVVRQTEKYIYILNDSGRDDAKKYHKKFFSELTEKAKKKPKPTKLNPADAINKLKLKADVKDKLVTIEIEIPTISDFSKKITESITFTEVSVIGKAIMFKAEIKSSFSKAFSNFISSNVAKKRIIQSAVDFFISGFSDNKYEFVIVHNHYNINREYHKNIDLLNIALDESSEHYELGKTESLSVFSVFTY